MGDDTPELIFVKSYEDTYNDYTYVTLNIYTYSDGECKEISFKDRDNSNCNHHFNEHMTRTFYLNHLTVKTYTCLHNED